MKIALPTRENQIDSHFGHCEYFTVFTTDDDKKIIEKTILESPEGCGCKSNIASVLAELGVTVMLAGNMGGGAVNVLNSNGITVVRGCSGEVKKVAKAWLEGKIEDSQVTCVEHEACKH